jgi:Chitobiase/beta-hexosaminidase C-terminal domain
MQFFWPRCRRQHLANRNGHSDHYRNRHAHTKPKTGSYSAGLTVTITDTTPGATIYCTTDETTPTASSSVYSSPITVSSTENIEAIAVASGYPNSAVAAAYYSIGFTSTLGEWSWMGGSNSILGNIPGARSGTTRWTDQSGNLWLFGGSYNRSMIGEFNDLWKFSPSTDEWTWMGGSNTVASNGGQPGVYGTLGTRLRKISPEAAREPRAGLIAAAISGSSEAMATMSTASLASSTTSGFLTLLQTNGHGWAEAARRHSRLSALTGSPVSTERWAFLLLETSPEAYIAQLAGPIAAAISGYLGGNAKMSLEIMCNSTISGNSVPPQNNGRGWAEATWSLSSRATRLESTGHCASRWKHPRKSSRSCGLDR